MKILKEDKYTSGPWRVHGDGITVGQSPRGQKICRTSEVFMSKNERKANARLIAIAPEMHATLREVLPYLEQHADQQTNELWVKVTAVLRKIENE